MKKRRTTLVFMIINYFKVVFSRSTEEDTERLNFIETIIEITHFHNTLSFTITLRYDKKNITRL
jgi:hypothetical protein